MAFSGVIDGQPNQALRCEDVLFWKDGGVEGIYCIRETGGENTEDKRPFSGRDKCLTAAANQESTPIPHRCTDGHTRTEDQTLQITTRAKKDEHHCIYSRMHHLCLDLYAWTF